MSACTASTKYPLQRGVHRLFEEQVERTPTAPALAFGEERLDYAELNRRANRLAHALIERGVGADRLVGVAMERSIEMVVALMAILKAGGAYVPVDPEYPEERQAYMLAGAFMTTGGVARRLIDFANACVGHIRGGLAIAAVLACMLFAALSGSSPATVAAVGSIAVAGMVRSGYPRAFGAGIICNAGTLGILIPPSIVMVVYAAATESHGDPHRRQRQPDRPGHRRRQRQLGLHARHAVGQWHGDQCAGPGRRRQQQQSHQRHRRLAGASSPGDRSEQR